MKTCSTCRVEKSKSEFQKNPSKRDGLAYQCKACYNAHKREHGRVLRDSYDPSRFPITGTKVCSKCKLEKSLGDFVIAKDKPSGYQSHCKSCKLAAQYERHNQNPEVRRKWGREWRKRKRNTDPQFHARDKIAYAKWREKKLLDPVWVAAEAIRLRGARRRWYPLHGAKRMRQWRKDHPDEVLEIRRNRDARKRAGVPAKITSKQWREVLEYFGHRCAYCYRDDVPLTMDHVRALALGGKHEIENIVPACVSCNCRKNDSGLIQWLARMSE